MENKSAFLDCFKDAIYVISDSVETLIKAIDDGATIVQLRDKEASLNLIEAKALEIIQYKEQKNFIFILNDYPDLAVEVKADGVHIGQDYSTALTREIIGPDMLLGKSTQNIEQGLEAENEGADYISVGPVFATPTKPGRPAVGIEYVKEAAQQISIPFVAIGGIDLTNVDEIIKAGAKTIGIVRAAGDLKVLLEKVKANK